MCSLSLQSPTPLHFLITAVRKTPSLTPFFPQISLPHLLDSSSPISPRWLITVTFTLAWLRNAGSRVCTKAKQDSLVSGRHHRAFFIITHAPDQHSPLNCWSVVSFRCIKATNYLLWTLHTSNGSYSYLCLVT